MRWPKYWSFSFSKSPSNEHPGLISFRMGWLDLLAVQGTLRSLLQHHTSKASILWHSAFFTAQLSHPYMTTGKTIALTRQNFVDKVISLLFNMLFSIGGFKSKCPRVSRITLLQGHHSWYSVIVSPGVMQYRQPWRCSKCHYTTGAYVMWQGKDMEFRIRQDRVSIIFCY